MKSEALSSEPRLSTPASASRKKLFEEILISLSLANLCFLGMWIQIFTLANPSDSYFWPDAPDWYLLLALILDIALLAAVLFLCLKASKSDSLPARVLGISLFALVTLFALNEIRELALNAVTKAHSFAYLKYLKYAVYAVLVVLVWTIRKRAARVWGRSLLIISPLFVILLANAAWLYRAPQVRRVGAGQPAGMLKVHTRSPRRIIWVVFDELDKHLAFEARPPRVNMPNFDRLLAESVHADKAVAPARITLLSLPSLITGREVAETKSSPLDLKLRYAGAKAWVDWSSQPTLFGEARAAGFNTGLSGWYHAYCRVLGKQLSSCAWDGSGGFIGKSAQALLYHRTLIQKAGYLANWQARSAPFLFAFDSAKPEPEQTALFRHKHILEYKNVLAGGLRMLKNPDIDLLLLHFPIPHPSGIWDSGKNELSQTKASNYLDNLNLSDRTLGEIRETLQSRGDWDRSAVLVTSDHPLRIDFWRDDEAQWDNELERETHNQHLRYVPFLLKLPGQKQGLEYPKQFNTVVTRALLWEILNGRIETPQAAATWLDHHSS